MNCWETTEPRKKIQISPLIPNSCRFFEYTSLTNIHNAIKRKEEIMIEDMPLFTLSSSLDYVSTNPTELIAPQVRYDYETAVQFHTPTY